MKYAFMSFSCPDLTFEDMLALAESFGYDGIEPRMQSGHAHGLELDVPVDARRIARDKAEEAGVAICCLATSCQYANPAETDNQVQDTFRAIDLAADLGCPAIRVFGGEIPGRVSRKEAMDLVVQSLRDIAPHAESKDVTVCMETHDSWCTPIYVADVMERVNHHSIAVNWDIMHPIRQGGATMDMAFDALRPWIRHVHFHDGTIPPDGFELRPIGQGYINHKRAVELLLKDGFAGYLSGEWMGWEPSEVHLPRELAMMKRYEREAM